VDARAKVAAAVASKAYGKRELVIRINGLDTPWGVDDLKMAAAAGPDAVLVPKVARPGDIVNVSRIHAAMGGAKSTRMWAMMETPTAIFNVREIAAAEYGYDAGGLDGVTPGSSCVANAYTSNHELIASGKIGSFKSFGLHVVDATGLVHALLLRIQALLLPIQTLVLSGH